jgi:hypothetical protein
MTGSQAFQASSGDNNHDALKPRRGTLAYVLITHVNCDEVRLNAVDHVQAAVDFLLAEAKAVFNKLVLYTVCRSCNGSNVPFDASVSRWRFSASTAAAHFAIRSIALRGGNGGSVRLPDGGRWSSAGMEASEAIEISWLVCESPGWLGGLKRVGRMMLGSMHSD